MDNPGNAAISETTNVSDAVKLITTDETGNYIFPEGVELSEELKFAATAEKRRRDTQSKFTSTQKSKLALEAENAKLKEALLKQSVEFTPEQREELNDLKMTDPETWRKKLNEYEASALKQREENINSLSNDVKTEAGRQFEETRRQEVLEEFNKANGISLTGELLANEVPFRITNKLTEGKINYEDFLEESLKYLTTTKVIAEHKVMNDPNLGHVSGGREPGKSDPEVSLSELYSGDLY